MNSRYWPKLATSLVVLALSACGGGGGVGGPSQIVAPNVVGDAQAVATTAITGAGLTVGAVTKQASNSVAVGNVISESPAAGTSVGASSAVALVVSSGPAPVSVPNVVGDAQVAATTAISGAGLAVGTVTTQSSTTIASGNVISESPTAGTSVSRGSAVNLVVSSGTPSVSVPNVVGDTQAVATAAIDGAGLVVGTITIQSSNSVASGNIISESPAAGMSVRTGSTVNLIVSGSVAAVSGYICGDTTGMVLSDNVEQLAIQQGGLEIENACSNGANGTAFLFPTYLQAGIDYTVTIQAQAPNQTCVLINAQGVTPGNSNGIIINCLASNVVSNKPFAAMPTPRGSLGVAVISNILYALGGTSSESQGNTTYANLEAFDPSTNLWTALYPMPTARSGLGVVAVAGVLYAIGGYDSGGNALATVEVYDPSTNSWSTLSSMPAAYGNIGVAVVGSSIYVVGGYSSNSQQFNPTLFAYDTTTDSWSAPALFPGLIAGAGVATVNNTVVVIGGYNTGGPAQTAYIYSPTSNSWLTEPASLPATAELPAVGVINNVLYSVGSDTAASPNVLSFDAMSDTWATLAPVGENLHGAGGGVINGVLYIVGGFVKGGTTTTVQTLAYAP